MNTYMNMFACTCALMYECTYASCSSTYMFEMYAIIHVFVNMYACAYLYMHRTEGEIGLRKTDQ